MSKKAALIIFFVLLGIALTRTRYSNPKYKASIYYDIKSARTCSDGHSLFYNETTKTASCIRCSEGCSSCRILPDGTQICNYCSHMKMNYRYKKDDSFPDRNWYMTDENTCARCDEGCWTCVGPGPENCIDLVRGYSYDRASNSIKKCPRGCRGCDSKGQCLGCEFGFIRKPLLGKTWPEVYECQPCKDKLCRICRTRYKQRSYPKNEIFPIEKCFGCFEGYTLLQDGTCRRCSENCESCFDKKSGCLRCKPGFMLEIPGEGFEESGICVKPQPKFKDCKVFNRQKQKCSICAGGLHLNIDETGKFLKGDACKPCSTLSPQCGSCVNNFHGYRVHRPSSNPTHSLVTWFENKCTSCADGWSLDRSTQKCEKVKENHCAYNTPRNPAKCWACIKGFFLDHDQKCRAKKRSKTCTWIREKDGKCRECPRGFYLDKGSGECKKCHHTCVSCQGSSSHDCIWTCDITRFIRHQLNRPRYKFSCVENPETILNPSEEVQHEFGQNLRYRYQGKKRRTIIEINDFRSMILGYIYEDIKARKIAQEKAGTDLSKTCGYRGVVKERLSSEKETVFECHCQPGYYGQNCLYTKRLYLGINDFISEYLTKYVRINIIIVFNFFVFQIFRWKRRSQETIC